MGFAQNSTLPFALLFPYLQPPRRLRGPPSLPALEVLVCDLRVELAGEGACVVRPLAALQARRGNSLQPPGPVGQSPKPSGVSLFAAPPGD